MRSRETPPVCPRCGEPRNVARSLPLQRWAGRQGQPRENARTSDELAPAACRWSARLPLQQVRSPGTRVPGTRVPGRRTHEGGLRQQSLGGPLPLWLLQEAGRRGHPKAPLSQQAGSVPESQTLPSPEAPFMEWTVLSGDVSHTGDICSTSGLHGVGGGGAEEGTGRTGPRAGRVQVSQARRALGGREGCGNPRQPQ